MSNKKGLSYTTGDTDKEKRKLLRAAGRQVISDERLKKMSELRPCPFCGEVPAVNEHWGFAGGCTNNECPNNNRDFQGACFMTEEEWNTRPTEDDILARLKKAVGEIEAKEKSDITLKQSKLIAEGMYLSRLILRKHGLVEDK